MNDLKWADVAHMCTKNEPCIVLEIEGVGKRELLWQQGSRGVMYSTSAQAKLSRWSQHKPILRHLEDMTEDEARDFDFYRSGYPWKEDDGSCAAFVKYQYRVYRDGVIKSYGSPIALHWLYKNGFDIHGLIESEQAIRKPKD